MISQLDLVVRGGKIVTPDGVKRADLGVKNGEIAQIASEITEEAHTEVDADGNYVFPGIIDAHVHFNEPGRTEWEGIASGSAALAAGRVSLTCRSTRNRRCSTPRRCGKNAGSRRKNRVSTSRSGAGSRQGISTSWQPCATPARSG